MNNYRTLVALLIIFVALAALITLQGEPETTPIPLPTATPPPQPQTDGTLLRVFPDLAVLDMQAIRLENLTSGDRFTLVRNEQGHWTAPDSDGELNPDTASSIARTLALFPYTRSLNILSDTDFSDYGFKPSGQLLFQIVTADGGAHVIAVGDLTETELAYYTLVDNRDEIFQVERGPVEFLHNFIASAPGP